MRLLSILAVLVALGTMFAPALSQAMSEAGDRKMQADKLLIERHKLYVAGYLDNLDNEADLDDDIVYQTSAQRQAAIHANAFLRKINGRE